MKRLTETWRQRKPLTGEKHAINPNTAEPESVKLLKTGTKRLGRVAVPSKSRIRCSSPCNLHGVPIGGNNDGKTSDLSFMSSFGPDLDEEIISVVNSIEEALQGAHQEDSRENSRVCDGGKTLPQSHTSSKEHSGVLHSLKNEFRNRIIKRKNSRSRMSGKREPVVLIDSKSSWLLSTSTQSPADKKRKEDSFVCAGRTGQLQIPSLKSCGVAMPSRNLLTQQQCLQQGTPHRIKKSLPQESKEMAQKFCRDDGKKVDCQEEEILVGESPDPFRPSLPDTGSMRLENMSSSTKKVTSKTAHKETPCHSSDNKCKQNQLTMAAAATRNVEKGGSDENIVEHLKVNFFPQGKGKEWADAKRSTASSFLKGSPSGSWTMKDADDLCVPVADSRLDVQGLGAQTSVNSANKPSGSICTSKNLGLGSGGEGQGPELRQQETSGSEQEKTSVLSLSAWGLPSPVLEAYQSQGITTMFPWQAECLTTGSVLAGGNLVYSAPTSAGKTMVAELLVLKRVLEMKRKALFILPFVSVTREKMLSLQRLYQDAGIRVGGFMGGYSPAGGFQSVDVAVCTIEKGNSLVNRLMEENRMGELGAVVIDELHLVGDSSRGYLLELLLTKVCFLAQKARENGNQNPVQVIGMSATLPNLNLLAKWLHADLYHTDFRPVPLAEHLKVGPVIFDASMKKIRELDARLTFQGDDDHIIPLCLETLLADHSVLIFCPTKVWCEKMAERIAREFHFMIKNATVLAGFTGDTGFVKASELIPLPVDQGALQNVVEQLGRSAAGVDPLLGRIVVCGVAYHHAGLTFDERDIVEGAFRQGLLKVLVATSTLSSGVNLPARRVIVRSPMFGGHVMDPLTYKQMAGRAGRKGVDTAGECILVCKETEKKAAQRLLQAELPRVVSCLSSGSESTELSRSLKRAILEVVVSGVAPTPRDVASYIDCTLLSASLPSNSSHADSLISSCLKFLEDNEFVHLTVGENEADKEILKYRPTQLGSAVLASSISPDEGLAVFAELQKARQCFVMSNELHIIYLVTPIYNQEISSSLDWYHFFCLWERLPPDQRSVAKLVGVEEGFLAKAITGRVPSKTAAQANAVAVHKRFYTALALHDLVQEMPLLEVAKRYRCNKGQLQSLMQSASTFAGIVTVFCARLGWCNMELLFSQFQQRLTLGVTRELCDLVRIPLLTASTARMLFNAGYQTVMSVAHAHPSDIEDLFHRTSPFQSNKKQEGETDWDFERRRKACIWLAGRKGLSAVEAAIAIIDEAKDLIQDELGVKINWANDQASIAESLSASASFSANNHTSEMRTPHSERRLSSRSCALIISGNRDSASPMLQYGVARDNFISPTSRKSFESSLTSGGKKVPVTVSQQRSAKRRSDSHGRLTQIKRRSPSVGSGQTQSRNLQKDLSFFGQSVVSPPPCLLKGRQQPSTPLSSKHGKAETSLQSRLVPEEIHSGKFRKIDVDVSKGAHRETDLAPCSAGIGISGENSTAKDSMTCLKTSPNQDEQECGGNSLSSLDAAKLETPSAVVNGFCDKQPQEGNKDTEGLEACFEESFVLDTQTVKLLAGERCTVRTNSNDHRHEVSEQVNSSVVFSSKTNLWTPRHDETQTKCLYRRDAEPGEDNLMTALPRTSFVTNICVDQKVGFDSSQKEKRHVVHRGSLPKALAKLETVQGQPTPTVTQKDLEDLGLEGLPFQRSDHFCKGKGIEENVDCAALQENKGGVPQNNKKAVNGQAGDASTSYIVDNEGDQSVSLIAASNYERAAYLEEGMVEDESGCLELNSSYQDLSIRHCSGNDRPVIASGDEEFTFIDDAAVTEATGIVTKNFNPAAGYNVQEDLAIAVNFSNESFSLCVTNNSDAKTSSPLIKNRSLQSATQSKEQESFFGDSFTASLMDKIMEENLICAQSDQDFRHTDGKTVSGKSVGNNNALNCSATESKKCLSFQDQVSTGKMLTKDMLEEGQALQLHQCLDKTEKRNLVTDSSKATTPQNNNDFVPPTPPEEQSSVSTPRLRKTPLRACKNRSRLEAGASQGKANTGYHHVEEDRKKKMDKENGEGKNKKQPSNLNKSALKTPAKSEQSKQSTVKTTGSTAQSKINNYNEKERDIRRHTKEQADFTSTGEEETLSERAADSELLTQESFTIIDVCANAQLFSTFVTEWKRKTSYAISLACDKKTLTSHPEDGIGGNFIKSVKSLSADLKATDGGVQGLEIREDNERVLVGIAVSWECRDAYYISLEAFGNGDSNTCLDDTMSAPPVDESLTLDQRTQAIKSILKLTRRQTSPTTVIVYDSKAVYSVLVKSVGAIFRVCQDPKIAAWLLDPGTKERNLHGMVTNFLAHDLGLLEGIGGGVGYGSLGLTVANPGSGRMRAAVESIISRRLMDVFQMKLADAGLERAFTDLEMPSVITMARMELNGIGFSNEECESQKTLMMARLTALEEEAYHLASHPFSLTSTEDIAQILYLELQLPVNGDPKAAKPVRTLGPSRRALGHQKAAFSTSKEVLEKLKPFHPLPSVILEWRRISSTLTKQVYTLQKAKEWSNRTGMFRIFGECQMHTATGRVSMSEPNLQNIPKDFEITLPDVIGESPPPVLCKTTPKAPHHRARAGNCRVRAMQGTVPQAALVSNPGSAQHASVSMRHAFIPLPGGVIVTADYSQLELRVIAHLSGDKKLISILNDDGDVFKMIAAQWKHIAAEAVTTEQRQQAKQVCYGMLYGIGAKALGEQLGVEENDAAAFIETFKARYTGLRSYLRKTVEECRENGYVSTISGRRRYLPSITSMNPHARAQAERQAVNTTVQGSAADIVKTAMNKIDHRLMSLFPDTKLPHRLENAGTKKLRGAFLVLQLHDELIYEVSHGEATQAAHIVKEAMETAASLLVKLPVKVKVGGSWGRLQEMEI